MNRRAFSVIILISLIVFSIFSFGVNLSFVSSQGELKDRAESGLGSIKDFGEGIAEGVGGIKDSIIETRDDYLSREWNEILLENGIVYTFDAIFTFLNPLFIFLFSRNYSLSFEMLFVFMLWLFVFLSMPKYFEFLKSEKLKHIVLLEGVIEFEIDNFLKYFAALAVTVIVAHMQVFNYIASGLIKIFNSSVGLIPKLVLIITTFLVVLFVLYVQNFANRVLRQSKEIEEKKELENKVKTLEKFYKMSSS